MDEEKEFLGFNDTDKLIWHEKGLKFGNWTDGPQMDGSRLFSTSIQASKVRVKNYIPDTFLYCNNFLCMP